MNSGYMSCGCPECFEIAIGSADDAIVLCWECKEAGCDAEGSCQCERDGDEEA
jgi:hypothetical protein